MTYLLPRPGKVVNSTTFVRTPDPDSCSRDEKDKIPFTKVRRVQSCILSSPGSLQVGVNYTYYVTRNGTDIISHKISYSAPGADPGDILYGNFTVVHDIENFRQQFTPPAVCNPQGSHKGHALSCSGEKIKEWERKYFKHSAAYNGWM